MQHNECNCPQVSNHASSKHIRRSRSWGALTLVLLFVCFASGFVYDNAAANDFGPTKRALGATDLNITDLTQPLAYAGPDQWTIIEGETVTLDGSRSADPEGDPIIAYQWTQLEGPSVFLVGADTATPNFTVPAVGLDLVTLVFQLIVSDPFMDSAPDTVAVSIRPLAGLCIVADEIQALIADPSTPAKSLDSLQKASARVNNACAMLAGEDYLSGFREIQKAVSALETASRSGAAAAAAIQELLGFVQDIAALDIVEASDRVCDSQSNVRVAQTNFDRAVASPKAGRAVTRFSRAFASAEKGISTEVNLTGSWAGTLVAHQRGRSAKVPIVANLIQLGTMAIGTFQESYLGTSGDLNATVCGHSVDGLNLEFGDGATGSGKIAEGGTRLTLKLSGMLFGAHFTASGTLKKQ